MQTFDLREFSSLYYPFHAMRLTGSRTVWISKKYCALQGAEDTASVKEEFNERFAWVVAGGVTFDGLQIDHARQVDFLAERYGGFGIARNGGGARCGDIGGFQVKGLGKNPLASSKPADLHHSYGGFKAVYAIHEAIYAHLINRIAPVGAAEIYGVTLLGERSAFVKDEQRGWGAQFVRERVLRPGSFLRARDFKIDKSKFPSMMSDMGRVRGVYASASKVLGDRDAVLNFFIQFVERTARQMSFARMARLMHGALTPSNLCLDGRWLDLTNTTFTCSTKNYAGGNRDTPSFYEERQALSYIIEVLARGFNKFAQSALPVEELKRHYQARSEEGLRDHLGYLFGLDYPIAVEPDRAGSARLTALIMRVLSGGQVFYDRWPETFAQDDPILMLLGILFTAAAYQDKAGLDEEVLRDEGLLRVMGYIQPFLSYMRHAHRIGHDSDIPYRYFLVASCITAVKRCILSAYFYKGRMETVVNRLLPVNDLDGVERFMEDSIELADWAFSGAVDGQVVILGLPCREIRYRLVDGKFLLSTANETSRTFATIGDLLDAAGPNAFELHGFDLNFYLAQLARTTDGMV